MSNKMRLGLAYHAFGTQASWRHPEVPRSDMTDFDSYVAMARKAESGLLDFMFAADSLTAIWPNESPDLLGRQPPNSALDPFTLCAALAGLTRDIGFISTVNTTYGGAPYSVARMLATLDHITHGRVGWNLVTGFNPEECVNFTDEPHPPADIRYERGAEFAKVMFGLWDSWEDDAFLCDKASGRYYDPAKMHVLDHHGKYFASRGPLTTPRAPQGRPVTVQAGSSEAGRELAAETADIVFTVAGSLEISKTFYADVKGRMAKFGRRPEEMLILPGVQMTVGRTDEEAAEKLARLEGCYDLDLALYQLNMMFGVDLSAYPLDEPFPDIPGVEKLGSRPQATKDLARAQGWTLRELAVKFTSYGHWVLAGTPKSIADQLEAFFFGGAADGFIIQPAYMIGGLNDIVDLVIPELQRRGLFRTRYEGATLRDRLGLKRPGIGEGRR